MEIGGVALPVPPLQVPPTTDEWPDADRTAELRRHLQSVMSTDAGVLRNAEGLIRCARVVDETLAAVGGPTLDGAGRRIDTAHVEVRNLAEIARVLVAAALARTESRGTHARSDFVATDPSQARRLVVGTLAP